MGEFLKIWAVTPGSLEIISVSIMLKSISTFSLRAPKNVKEVNLVTGFDWEFPNPYIINGCFRIFSLIPTLLAAALVIWEDEAPESIRIVIRYPSTSVIMRG